VRAKINTTAAMDTDINSTVIILKNSINGAGGNAVTTINAELFLYYHSPAFSLRKGTCGAGRCTGRRVAGKALACLEACG